MPAEEIRETTVARLGNTREETAARTPVPQGVAVVRGTLEAKAPEGKLAAQGREAEAPREPAA